VRQQKLSLISLLTRRKGEGISKKKKTMAVQMDPLQLQQMMAFAMSTTANQMREEFKGHMDTMNQRLEEAEREKKALAAASLTKHKNAIYKDSSEMHEALVNALTTCKAAGYDKSTLDSLIEVGLRDIQLVKEFGAERGLKLRGLDSQGLGQARMASTIGTMINNSGTGGGSGRGYGGRGGGRGGNGRGGGVGGVAESAERETSRGRATGATALDTDARPAGPPPSRTARR
jgi:uncharacterized membrane protein YgcG